MEYVQTWKRKVTPLGRSYWAHTASGHRTSGRDSTSSPKGWTTPQAHDATARGKGQKLKHGTTHGCADLNADADMPGWPTPAAQEFEPGQDGIGAMMDRREEEKAKGRNGNGFGLTLGMTGHLSGWPTPRTPTGGAESAERKKELGRTESGGGDLQSVAHAAGWATPRAEDAESAGMRHGRDVADTPSAQAEQVAGWATPTVQDGENCAGLSQYRRQSHPLNVQATLGSVPSGSPAGTARRGVLNPALPLWLMGFPSDWLMAAPLKVRRGRASSGGLGIPSSRKSRRSSSAPISKCEAA